MEAIDRKAPEVNIGSGAICEEGQGLQKETKNTLSKDRNVYYRTFRLREIGKLTQGRMQWIHREEFASLVNDSVSQKPDLKNPVVNLCLHRAV